MDDTINKKITLLVTSIAAFLTPFMGSSINIALPSIGREFTMDAVMLNWIAAAHILASAMFLVPFGKIADIHGRKRIFIYGIFVYSLSSLLSSLSVSGMMLICFRVLQGVGSAMIAGTSIAILNSAVPVEERGRALGINVAAVYMGLSLGPFAGGILTQHFGWRAIFIANVILGLTAAAFAVSKLKGEWAEAKGERFDFFGTIIYSVSLVSLMYGLSKLPALYGAVLAVSGAAGIFAFVRWELKAESPLLNMNLFKDNPVFAFSNLAAFINYSATFAVGFLLSLYLQYIKGFTPQEAGFVLVAQPIVMAVFSPVAGRISDRVEPRIVSSIGMGVAVIGLSLFIFINDNTSIGFITGGLVLLGFGFALFSSPNTNAVMSSVEKRYYGVAASALGTMRLTGQMISMGIVMLVFSMHIGKVQITPEYHGRFLDSVQIILIIFAVLCFGGIFASLARGKVR